MMWCWEMEPGERPTFSTLIKTLSKSLETMAGYLPVGALNENACNVQDGANVAKTDHEALTIDYRGTYV